MPDLKERFSIDFVRFVSACASVVILSILNVLILQQGLQNGMAGESVMSVLISIVFFSKARFNSLIFIYFYVSFPAVSRWNIKSNIMGDNSNYSISVILARNFSVNL